MLVKHPLDSLSDIEFVSLCVKHKGQYALCFHRERQSWECAFGHVESDESALAAARRTLYEATGAMRYDIVPAWDYSVLNKDGSVQNNGRWYYIDVHTFGTLSDESEMEKLGFFDTLPQSPAYDQDEILSCFHITERYASAYSE